MNNTPKNTSMVPIALIVLCVLLLISSVTTGVLFSFSGSGEDIDDTTPTPTPASDTDTEDEDEDEPSITRRSGGTRISTSSDENNDCVGDWGEWSDCTQECSYQDSKGEKVRTYSVELPATGKGKACPYDDGEEEVQECGKVACTPKDCVGNWTAWSVEGVGANAIEKRTWDVTQEPKYGGAACSVEESARIETKAASASTPSVDCVGSWVNVGTCSKTCGPDGKQKRRYDVTTPASGPNGKSCTNSAGVLLKDGDIDETEECNTDIVCPVNCVGSFSNWSSCSESCGPGKKRRTYSVTTPVAGTGTACAYDDGHEEMADCEDKPCDVNCEGQWLIRKNDIGLLAGGNASKITWEQTQAKSGNGADCRWDFIRNGTRNQWESKNLNDGDTAEFYYENMGDVGPNRFVEIVTGKGQYVGQSYKWCVRPSGGTGTASAKGYAPICDGDE